MIRAASALVALAVLPGCIFYDHVPHPCRGCDSGVSSSGDPGREDTGDDPVDSETDSAPDTGPLPDTPVYTLDPDSADAGETLIVSLTGENADLESLQSIDVYGPATILATDNRGDEILFTLAVDPDASGALDFLLLRADGGAEWLEDAFTVNAVDEADTGSGDTGAVDTGGEDTGAVDTGTDSGG